MLTHSRQLSLIRAFQCDCVYTVYQDYQVSTLERSYSYWPCREYTHRYNPPHSLERTQKCLRRVLDGLGPAVFGLVRSTRRIRRPTPDYIAAYIEMTADTTIFAVPIAATEPCIYTLLLPPRNTCQCASDTILLTREGGPTSGMATIFVVNFLPYSGELPSRF